MEDRRMSSNLLEAARQLAVADRIALVEAIWDTVAEDAGLDVMPLPEEHRAELDHRLADLVQEPDAGSSWEEVKARLERAR